MTKNRKRTKQSSKINLSYIAGFIDGEGCLTIKVRKTSSKQKSKWTAFHSPSISIVNNEIGVLLWIKQYLNKLNINSNLHKRKLGGNVLELNSLGVSQLTKLLYPYLKVKQPQAKILLLFENTIKRKTYRNKKGQYIGKKILSKKEINYRNELTKKIRILNKKYNSRANIIFKNTIKRQK